MVERPIKKSEKQAANSETAEERPSGSLDRKERKERGGRDRKNNQREERVQPVNPALLRGPRPVKPKPTAEETTPAELEQSEDSAEGSEAEATLETVVEESTLEP